MPDRAPRLSAGSGLNTGSIGIGFARSLSLPGSRRSARLAQHADSTGLALGRVPGLIIQLIRHRSFRQFAFLPRFSLDPGLAWLTGLTGRASGHSAPLIGHRHSGPGLTGIAWVTGPGPGASGRPARVIFWICTRSFRSAPGQYGPGLCHHSVFNIYSLTHHGSAAHVALRERATRIATRRAHRHNSTHTQQHTHTTHNTVTQQSISRTAHNTTRIA